MYLITCKVITRSLETSWTFLRIFFFTMIFSNGLYLAPLILLISIQLVFALLVGQLLQYYFNKS